MERLTAWLDGHLEGFEAPLEVRQYPRGWSNLTYLLTWDGGEAVLRRPPAGARAEGGHDMEREHRVLQGLHGRFPVPRPLLRCDDPSVVGAPFFLMERVPGLVLRADPPEEERPDPGRARKLGLRMADLLADLHGLDPSAAGLEGLGRPEGYVTRQVEGWTRRWAAARTEPVPAMEEAAAWLADHRPEPEGAAVLHNDFKHDNLVLDPEEPTRVRAVLDWEMATVGDPLMDLGTSLAYWVEPDDPPALRALGLGPTLLDGTPTREQFVARYAAAAGIEVDAGELAFHRVYGLFKLAVIVQQIHQRWKLGHTDDPRFAELPRAVRACAVAALDVAGGLPT